MNKRQSGIELLRIIAMLLIVAHHFSVHSGFEYSATDVSLNGIWIQLISMGGKIGVNIFVIISGYYMTESSKSVVGRVIKLWLQIEFYSIVIFAVMTLFGQEIFSIKELIKHCMPVVFSQWWFATNYIVLCLLSPFINTFVDSISASRLRELLLMCTILWSIVPVITNMYLGCTSLVWFVYLYMLAAYIKKFGLKDECARIICKMSFVVFVMLCVLTVLVDILSTRFPSLYEQSTRLYGPGSSYFTGLVYIFFKFKNII